MCWVSLVEVAFVAVYNVKQVACSFLVLRMIVMVVVVVVMMMMMTMLMIGMLVGVLLLVEVLGLVG